MNWTVEKFKRPFEMAFGIYLICMLIFTFNWLNAINRSQFAVEVWLYGAVACFVFGLFSALLLLFAQNRQKLWNQSVLAYILLLIVHVVLSYFISGKSIMELDMYRQILILITIAVLVFITIAGLIKKVESWSRNQDNFKKS
ncbi:hypothetical protein [Membranihabitans marinus]|uniref:hypothetical protein n=1 Tax=Membranihabitans marinus TaxID=1227546 RepID=UPI001F413382|nr:hypothetical protein [Membranihabitans marinus]